MKPRGHINTPAKVKAAREYLGLSKAALARLLRYGSDGRGALRMMETGEQKVPGAVQLALEALVSGWRPHGVRLKIDKEANLIDETNPPELRAENAGKWQ